MTEPSAVTVVGGGLAGCEAAWQLACRGIAVTLVEQKPLRRTAAQTGDGQLLRGLTELGAAQKELFTAIGLPVPTPDSVAPSNPEVAAPVVDAPSVASPVAPVAAASKPWEPSDDDLDVPDFLK